MLLLTLVLGSAPVRGYAEDFFRVSPGKLSRSHAEWDNSDGCTKCHQLGGGVTNALCLDCHAHQRLKAAIAKGEGLHARFKQRCIACHTDHKGEFFNITNWKPVGGRAGFDHGITKFALTGAHAKQSCSACHKRRRKSGRISYQWRSRDCATCHKGVHRFDSAALRDNCALCHAQIRASRKMTASSAGAFDHRAVAGVELAGAHRRVTCGACHPNGRMNHRARPRGCKSCHKNPHGRGFSKKRCGECHSPERPWRKAGFDHSKTRYPLHAEHRAVACAKCHKQKRKPSRDCAGCHGEVHRSRFGERSCASCHTVSGAREVRFDHGAQTEFALHGRHAALGCRDCHRGRRPTAFERLEQQKCCECHKHKHAHDCQFEDQPCARCHIEGGERDRPFDHNVDARFALTGLHAPLRTQQGCIKCHPKRAYRTGKLACVDCHKDPHAGQLGRACERCHSVEVPFKQVRFDHGETRFPLTGLHAEARCDQCHGARGYKLGQPSCYDCHAATEPHRGALGRDCARCHTPDRGAPRFDHDEMTAFALTGAHRRAPCRDCHRDASVPATDAASPELDLRFPLRGRRCVDCHRDHHAGRYGSACASCHNTSDFKQVEGGVHDTGPFRLQGAHDQIACGRCHDGEASLRGVGDQCLLCHREDDVHRNSLGAECGQCHRQTEWTAVRFSHHQVGLPLRGAHRSARCADCHVGGVYLGLSAECADCHLEQAATALDPIHTAELIECADCHSEASFSPARVRHLSWPLRGAHRAVACQRCHGAGPYVGAPDACEDCHRQQLYGTRDPDHLSAGFDFHCGECHTSSSWSVARYWHQGFRPRGLHLALACLDCHPGEGYGGAFGGLSWDCGACHGPGGPVDQWPPEHEPAGYPHDCELCHRESGWLPATEAP